MHSVIWRKPEPWDVIVVGSGATGGWAAYLLAKQGLKVLVLEAGADGPDFPPEAPAGELQARRVIDRLGQRRPVQSRHASYWELDPELFVLDAEHPYETAPDRPFDWIRTRAVNGRLLTWGGIGVRASDYEFRAPEQDGFGARWPIGYADLAPHYDDIDRFLPVWGERDRLPQLPDGSYVRAPQLTDAEHAFKAAVEKTLRGRSVIAARGVLTRPGARRKDEEGPPSPLRVAVNELGVTLRTDAVVSHLLVDDRGRATGVAFVDRLSKRSHEVYARSVALCASTLESTRIMLNSRSRQHPEGLGNSSGALGRYLMDHPAVYVRGFAPGDRDDLWDDGWGGPKNLMIPRFHNLENRAGGAFLRGYGMFGGIGRHVTSMRGQCEPDEAPFTLVSYGEMLPRFENRATLSKDRVDAWGIPVLRMDCAFGDNEHALRAHMIASIEEMVEAAGGRVVGEPTYVEAGGFVHEVGTARMGTSPKDSVVSSFGQCWDVPNVYVMDGAAWPTALWQNPTFTMMAIAGRASEHLAHALRTGEI